MKDTVSVLALQFPRVEFNKTIRKCFTSAVGVRRKASFSGFQNNDYDVHWFVERMYFTIG
jgi:hypothetical protein